MQPETISLRHSVPLRCQMLGNHEQLPHQGDMLFLQVIDAGNVQFRDHQDVYGCLGVNVFKGHDRIVFVHNSGWYTLGDDVTENTRHGLRYSPHPSLLPCGGRISIAYPCPSNKSCTICGTIVRARWSSSSSVRLAIGCCTLRNL